MTKYLLIDGNSLGNAAHAMKPLTLGDMQVQAIFGFLRTLRKHVAMHQDYTPVVLWDGMSWRASMFREYKANREKTDTKHEKESLVAKKHYHRQRPYIEKALAMIGVTQIVASNMEADDLAAMLSDRYSSKGNRVLLMTADKDWIQLVNSHVTWKDPIHNLIVTPKTFEEMTGVKTVSEFVQMKALCGDTGDNISGVGGIGQKGAIDFISAYGTFNNFINQVMIEKTVDFAKLPKKFRDLVDDEEKAIIFERNIKLMDLRTPARPKPENMSVIKGDGDADKFKRFCEILLFNSILADLNAWLAPFPAFREAVE